MSYTVTGNLQFLSLNIYRNMADPNISSFSPCFPTAIFSTKLCSVPVGKYALILELGYQPHLRSTASTRGVVAAAVPHPPHPPPQDISRSPGHVTRYGPHERARIRAFFAEGVDKLLFPCAVEALLTMQKISSSRFLPPLLYSYGMFISRFSRLCYRGSAFVQLSTHSPPSFIMVC